MLFSYLKIYNLQNLENSIIRKGDVPLGVQIWEDQYVYIKYYLTVRVGVMGAVGVRVGVATDPVS